MAKPPPPPPTRFGIRPGVQPKPATPAASRPAPPPTKFGPSAGVQLKSGDRGRHTPPPTKFGTTGAILTKPGGAPAGYTAPPPTRYGNARNAAVQPMIGNFFRRLFGRQQQAQEQVVAEEQPPPRQDKYPLQKEYDKYLVDTEYGAVYWDDDEFYGKFISERLISKSDETMPAVNHNYTANDLFLYFTGEKSQGIKYFPNGVVNCMTLSDAFRRLLQKYGIAGVQEHIGAGNQRVVINCPRPIDPSWSENTTIMNNVILDRVRHFSNHYYVTSGGAVYDPTGGYGGPANNFSAILEPIAAHAGYYTVVGQPAFLHNAAYARMENDVLTLFTQQPAELAE